MEKSRYKTFYQVILVAYYEGSLLREFTSAEISPMRLKSWD
jgi:hypothetical protein